MNALLRKEVRLLLPSFAAALLLTFALWFIPKDSDSHSGLTMVFAPLAVIACPLTAVFMALNSFGREITAGTFAFLLAQPIARTRVWRVKTLLLAAALLIVLLSWVLTFHFRFADQIARSDPTAWKWAPQASAALFALVAFSGGLWTVLFFRQVTAAFWFALIVPGAVLIGFINLMERHPVAGRNFMMLALVFYSVAGFFFARWLFLRAQDVKATGGEITLPHGGWWSLGVARAGGRWRLRPRAALWRKELQLHQSQFVLAGVLLLLHLAVLGTRKFVTPLNSGTLDFILETFWVLWLFMPLLVGCTAVAEERKLGTLEGQLGLPATRRRQFIIKFLSALLLSLLLGAVLPLLLDRAKILPMFDPHFGESSADYPNGYYSQFGPSLGKFLSVTLPFLTLAGIAALIGTVSFYASTLARNTLQSLAPAVLGLLLVGLIWGAAGDTEEILAYRLWQGRLVYLIGVPVFVATLVALMFWNFKRVLVDGPVWRHNVLVLVGAMAFVSTTTVALYHRAWEYFGPLEPPHGSPVLALKPPRASLRLEGWRPMVELPDGRVWVSRMGHWDARGLSLTHLGDTSGVFLDGTNWAKIAATHRDLAGVRKDGSLWVSERPEKIPAPRRSPPASARMMRLGTENDWSDLIVHQFQTILLLKTNGTLWELGTNHWSTNHPWPGLRAFTPQRLGVDSNWTALSSLFGRVVLHQRDGGFWLSSKFLPTDTNTLVLHAGLTLYRAPELDPTGPPSMHAAWKRGSAQVAVLPDGTFRVVSFWGYSNTGGKQKWGMQTRDVIIGAETNWLAVAGNYYDTAVTLKADGTLWKWEFPDDPAVRPDTAVATQLGTHSDWVAVSAGWGGIFALARDGSLWLWRLPSVHLDRSRYALLAPPRRPERLGNIFGPAEP